MSVKSVVDFYNKVANDNESSIDFSDINKDTITEDIFYEKILPEAKRHGYDFTYDDVKKYYDALDSNFEINENDLKNVSGGSGCKNPNYSKYTEVGLNDTKAQNCRWYVPRGESKNKTCGMCTYCNNYNGKYYCIHVVE